MSVTGPYDNLLTFIKDIYGLPRLTQINALTISGGGPNTSRSTVLNMTATLTIFTTAKSTAAAP